MNQSWPFYARLTLILVTIFLILYGIYVGQDILLPFGFAFLIAVLLQPIEKFIRRFKIPRVMAILIAILTAFVFLTMFKPGSVKLFILANSSNNRYSIRPSKKMATQLLLLLPAL